MSTKYIQIDTLLDIEQSCPNQETKPITFIGILRDIIHSKDSIYFNFLLLNSENENLATKLKVNETFSCLNGNLATKLLLRSLNLRITDDFTKEWQMNDIFIQKLCLFCIEGQCIVNEANITVFIEDMKHLSLKRFADHSFRYMKSDRFLKDFFTKSESFITEWHMQAISRCFKTLCRMDSDPNNPFSFEQLADKEDINSDRIQKLIHHCQTINKRARPATISLFPNLRMIDSLASQNEFNSQVMDTQRSYQDSNDFASYGDNNNSNEIFTDANELLPSGNVVELAYHTTGTNLDTLSNESLQNQGHLDMEEMGPLPVDKEWDPQSFINMQLDARYKIEAKYIASRKLEDYNEIFLKPVRDHFFDDEEDNKDFKPKFKKSENILLEPYYNCIQTKGSSFTNIIIGDNIDLKIDALLKGVEHSREIPYVMPELRNYETERLAAREYFTEQPPVEVFKKWKDIAIDEKMPQFVKIVAMLLSCSYEKSSYVDIVFTDFTTNPNGHKYGVPLQYLINKQHYMSFDDCIKARIYNNQFAKFISELKEVGHAELANELNQVGQTETFRNVSAMGIVCELTLKVTRYRDNLSLIVRKCDPLPRKQINERRWYNDKKAISNLHDLYEKTERKLSEISFSFRDLGEPVLDEYTKYFPFEISDSDVGAMIIIPPDELYFENPLNHNEDDQNTNNNDEDTPELPLEPLASTIPGLNIDISEFRLTNQTDNFNILYKLQTSDDEIFVIENVKLISWKFLYRANTVILTVTDDLTSTVVTDPTRLLRINIVNRDNLVYFCNGDEEISPLHRLDLLVNKTFNFKLQTGKLKLNDKYLLKIFCPIECTLEELKSQVEVRQSNLETNDEINNITNGSVKQEMD